MKDKMDYLDEDIGWKDSNFFLTKMFEVHLSCPKMSPTFIQKNIDFKKCTHIAEHNCNV